MRWLWMAVLLGGCASSMATMQPAATLGKGDFHLGGGSVVNVPVSRSFDLYDRAKEIGGKYISDPGYEPTPDEQQDLLDAGIGLALNPPSVVPDFMLRYGFAEGFDAGARWSLSGVHADVKTQFLRGEWDGSISLGFRHHLYNSFLFDVASALNLAEFSRNDIEIPVLFGKRLRNWGLFWAGPKYIGGKYSVEVSIENVAGVTSADGYLHYFGGLAGFGLGYRWIHVFAEVTAMYLHAKPTFGNREVDMGGIVIAPAAGLMARF